MVTAVIEEVIVNFEDVYPQEGILKGFCQYIQDNLKTLPDHDYNLNDYIRVNFAVWFHICDRSETTFKFAKWRFKLDVNLEKDQHLSYMNYSVKELS